MKPRSTIEDAAAWADPEVWPPEGQGCSWCHVRPPLVLNLPFGGALCDLCLERALSPWGFERIVEWLGRQKGLHIRVEARRAAIKAREKGEKGLMVQYEKEYGVSLEVGKP